MSNTSPTPNGSEQFVVVESPTAQLTVKIHYSGSNTMRRARVPAHPTLEMLKDCARNPQSLKASFILSWRDVEGDPIMLLSNADVEAALAELPDDGILRLDVASEPSAALKTVQSATQPNRSQLLVEIEQGKQLCKTKRPTQMHFHRGLSLHQQMCAEICKGKQLRPIKRCDREGQQTQFLAEIWAAKQVRRAVREKKECNSPRAQLMADIKRLRRIPQANGHASHCQKKVGLQAVKSRHIGIGQDKFNQACNTLTRCFSEEQPPRVYPLQRSGERIAYVSGFEQFIDAHRAGADIDAIVARAKVQGIDTVRLRTILQKRSIHRLRYPKKCKFCGSFA